YSRSNNNNIESWNLEYLKKSEYDRLYKIYGELASSMLGNNNDEGRPEIKSYLDFEVKYEGGAMINRMESIRLLEEEISKIKARDEKIRTETAQTEDGTAMRDVAPPSEPELESSYEVQKNDNLWKILKEKYNLSNAEIQKAIPLLIEFQPD
ncbi:MAG: LysM peptidoglycan-binding domain-containing protein, partial [Candidatus Peribacteria bacterium]|nr:LysM peptidoglycan-binding domain-containing protein [Candidatus Peribacteria bacterium]